MQSFEWFYHNGRLYLKKASGGFELQELLKLQSVLPTANFVKSGRIVNAELGRLTSDEVSRLLLVALHRYYPGSIRLEGMTRIGVNYRVNIEHHVPVIDLQGGLPFLDVTVSEFNELPMIAKAVRPQGHHAVHLEMTEPRTPTQDDLQPVLRVIERTMFPGLDVAFATS